MFFPNFDGTKDSAKYVHESNSENSNEDSEQPELVVDCSGGGYHWQTNDYWKLPQNVRHAIDVGELK